MKSNHFDLKNLSVLLLIVILIQTSSNPLQAQKVRQNFIAPVMKVSNPSKSEEQPMHLNELKIDIKVIGQIAVTTLDMTYFNKNMRVMEGEFNFPLGEGMTVSRFALDINGQLREGVVVDKELGRKTFEAIVRRGIDPGLLEMTEGNNFRARVYPFMPEGSRRVVIAYEQELADNGESDLYLLPLNISESVKKFTVHAEVIKNQLTLDSDKNELENLSFNKWNDSYVADLEKENYTPNQQIALSFPHLNDSVKLYVALKNADSSYFYLNFRPKSFEKEKKLPHEITLLWDNSGSAQNRNFEKEFALLDSYFKKIGNLKVNLIPVNIATGKQKSFEISNGIWDALKNDINSLVMDGGTSFSAIDFKKLPGEEILWFTDGISNFGSQNSSVSDIPVITVNSSLSANHDFLRYIAQRNGGVYINLTKLNSDQASSLLFQNNYHFISAKVESGNISGYYPSIPCQFTKTFSMAGILKGDKASLILNFGFGNTIVYSKKIQITSDNSMSPELVRRLWAEKKIEELNFDQENNADEITAVAKQFGIVTRNTSLIVLENLNDYVQYHIVPPKELQEEYYRIINKQTEDKQEKLSNKIDEILKLQDEQTKWWNTRYPVQPPVAQKNKSVTQQQVRFNAPVVVEEVMEEVELVTADEVSEVVNEAPPEEMVVSDETHEEVTENSSEGVWFVEENPARSADLHMDEANKIPENVTQSNIQLNAWDPQTPYLKVLEYTVSGQEYPTYLKLKKEYGTTPSFYIDASDFFAKMGKTDTAILILSNLAELRLEEPQLLRILAERLLSHHCYEEAIIVYEKILKLRGEDPQSYRDLGLAYAAAGKYQQAVKTLYDVVQGVWDGRFPEIEIIVLNDINNIIAKHPGLELSFFDQRLIRKEPVDVRVVLSWDTDNCDMDLWVTDPQGEKCFYEHRFTNLGGKISRDYTQGLGPEEFMIKKALNGEYIVQANYYGSRSQKLLAPVNLHLTFYTNFGKPDEKKQEVSLRLDNQKDIVDVGKFIFKSN